MRALSRIGVLGGICVALWLLVQPGTAVASGADLVRGFYQSLMYNMQYGPSLGQQGRVARLAPLVPVSLIFPI
jgi:hypothetical protein